jgi:hypothetical protein
MKNMNPKLVKLLHEGISIVTLEKLNDKQLDVLFERVSNKKETKEATTKTTTSTTYNDDELKKGVPGGKMIMKNPDGTTTVTKEGEISEKSVSKQQQKIMGLALSVKRGDTKKSEVSKKVQDMAKKMSEKDLEDFAGTKHKGLPKKKKDTKEEEVKKLEESIMRLVENHLYPQVKKSDLIGIINKGKK